MMGMIRYQGVTVVHWLRKAELCGIFDSATAMENLGPVLQGIVGRVEDLEDFTGVQEFEEYSAMVRQ
ncbi:hypothetical protein AK812_SmicGene49038, partial [Symbiodinium microadriaticum]